MANILIAEDNTTVGAFLSNALRGAGHRVDLVGNGVQALSELQDDDSAYDVLFADVTMPGMDGVELVSRAADLHPALRALFIKGFSAVPVAQSGAGRALEAPIHLKDVVRTVDRLLAA